MAFYVSPLVDVNEIDKSAFVTSVASSVAYIVVRNAYKGPEMEMRHISDENDLVETFGYPIEKVKNIDGTTTKTSTNVHDMMSAIGYLNHGRNLYVTRTMPLSATFAGVKVEDDGTFVEFDESDALRLKTKTYTGGDISEPDNFHEEISDTTLGTDDVWMIAGSRGYWGNNIRVALVDQTTQTQILSGGLDSYKVENLDEEDQDKAIYNVVTSLDSPLSSTEDFLVIVQTKAQKESLWRTTEVWNVSTNEDALDDQGRTKFAELKINNDSNWIRMKLSEDVKNNDVPNDWVKKTFTQFGGGADHLGDSIEDGILIEAYELASNPEDIDINIMIDGNKSENVKSQILSICESRLDCMEIADVLYDHVVTNKGQEVTDVVNWRKGIDSPSFNVNSSYIAIYGNWFEVYDKYNRKYRWVPSSGYVAGIYANNDNEADPWFAPAGLRRAIFNGVRRLAWNPDKGERDQLYRAGINPIISFSGEGKVIWGQKTMLNESSAFNRVNVRRLFMVLEKALSTSAKYFLFEPNDRETRKQLVATIEPFLNDVKSRRGIYDYLVVCDTTNNTPARIDRSELWCDIYIKPTKAAEFIVLNFIATSTGASFTELAAA